MDALGVRGDQYGGESDLESITSDVVYQGRGGAAKVSHDNDYDTTGPSENASLSALSDGEPDGQDDLDDQYGNEDGEEVPEHACAYCGIHTPSSVVKCVTCDKWFCNARDSLSSSHIVMHLVRARHKTVKLHPESDLGDTTLECYNCGNKNVFLLGFISAKSETVVVILCRHPCATSPSAGMNWDTKEWQPLIEERSFLPWLVTVPSEREQLQARHLSPAQVMKLEALWRDNAGAKISDLDKPEAEEVEMEPVPLRFDDAYEYQRSFSPLVKYEAEYDKKLRESQTQTGVSVIWDMGLSKRYLVSFVPDRVDMSELKISIGDKLQLRHEAAPGKWSSKGYVVKIPDGVSDEVTVELQDSSNVPTSYTTDFTVEFLWSNTTYARIQDALRRFATEDTSVSGYIYHKLLGHDIENLTLNVKVPSSLSAPGVPELNESQRNAVKSVLQMPLSLIQGPPGTGKTVVSTSIVYHLVKLTKEPVLVCAPSNVVVDQLAERLTKAGLNVVRVVARTREDLSSKVEHATLHRRVRDDPRNSKLVKLMELKQELGELDATDGRKYFKLLRAAEQRIIKEADVICATCAGAGDTRLNNVRFRTALIDESTQAMEPECLIPVVHGVKQLVLVGDHQQLGPVISNRSAANAGLSRSLFERLILLGHKPIRLTVQYRMHPSLSLFPSNMFYEGSLQNGVTVADRTSANNEFPWPVPDLPMFFWANLGQEEISASGISYLNRSEAVNCEKLVSRLFKAGIQPHQIGIVTPYEGQRTYLAQYMIANGEMNTDWYREVEIESVDAFQGREKDYIILSCVRSNSNQGIGFLRDPRRLNVAITRAKFGLILLGNPRVLSRNFLWSSLLNHFKSKGVLVEGSLNYLRQSHIPLSKPRMPLRETRRDELNGFDPFMVPNDPRQVFPPQEFDPHQHPQLDYNQIPGAPPSDGPGSALDFGAIGGEPFNLAISLEPAAPPPAHAGFGPIGGPSRRVTRDYRGAPQGFAGPADPFGGFGIQNDPLSGPGMPFMFGDASDMRSWASKRQAPGPSGTHAPHQHRQNGTTEAERMLGNSMADRMAQILQDIEKDSAFDDDIGDLSTSFANKTRLF